MININNFYHTRSDSVCAMTRKQRNQHNVTLSYLLDMPPQQRLEKPHKYLV